jgi:hypothetical protein
MKDRTAYICFVIIVIMMIFMGFFVDKCPAQEYFEAGVKRFKQATSQTGLFDNRAV